MNEYIICKSDIMIELGNGISVIEPGEFLSELSFKVWPEGTEVWTIEINGRSIDYYLTEAQYEIGKGIVFEKTKFYEIITQLIGNGVKVAMWYDTYCEELPICNGLSEVYSTCYSGITDGSGMCEVYFRTD
ncbi:MAG: hypothetical protein IJB96_03150 [Lachnospira sp.]|nr:hypothetical protein [Lachnospira sp.]